MAEAPDGCVHGEKTTMSETIKYLLAEEEIPESWYNIAADLPSPGVAVVGELPAGVPQLAIPVITPSRLTELLPSVAMLVLVGFVESIAVAKTIAAKVGYEIDPDRELIGLGLQFAFTNLIFL